MGEHTSKPKCPVTHAAPGLRSREKPPEASHPHWCSGMPI